MFCSWLMMQLQTSKKIWWILCICNEAMWRSGPSSPAGQLSAESCSVRRPAVRPAARAGGLGWGSPDRVGDLEKQPRHKLRGISETGSTSKTLATTISAHVWCFLCINHQDDMQRRTIWVENKRKIEDNNHGFLVGMRTYRMAMNRYGDLVRSSVFCSCRI